MRSSTRLFVRKASVQKVGLKTTSPNSKVNKHDRAFVVDETEQDAEYGTPLFDKMDSGKAKPEVRIEMRSDELD